MKLEIEVAEYRPQTGIRWDLEPDSTIEVRLFEKEVLIKADRAGLISLARLCLTLAQEEVPKGSHMHLDEHTVLEATSYEVIMERM